MAHWDHEIVEWGAMVRFDSDGNIFSAAICRSLVMGVGLGTSSMKNTVSWIHGRGRCVHGCQ